MEESLTKLSLKDAPDDDHEMMDTEDITDLRLDTLPTEILLHIFDNLEVKFITDVVSRVCFKFRDIADNDATWRIRISRRWPGQYPPIPLTSQNTAEIISTNQSSEEIISTNDSTDGPASTNQKSVFSWTQACIMREEEAGVWSNVDAEMMSVTCLNTHYSSVDCVRVINNLVVSGSRDRGINIWNTDSLRSTGDTRPAYKLPDAHKGWVWSLSSCGHGSTLVSGSWDNTVKFWSLTPASLQETRKPVNLKVAVLSTDMLNNTVVAGTYDKKVIMMDRREEVKRMTFYRSHSKPVLGVKMTERHIFSVSEDQSLVVYDRVAGKRMKKLSIPGEGFPLSLSVSGAGQCLYVGDKSGTLHLIDTSFDR